MIYLASPYSHDDPMIKQFRFEAVCRVAAKLMNQGHMIFSPIAHTHPIAAHGLPGGWEYWEIYDRQHITFCAEIWILMLDGWEESKGIRGELKLAKSLGKKVRYLEADGDFTK